MFDQTSELYIFTAKKTFTFNLSPFQFVFQFLNSALSSISHSLCKRLDTIRELPNKCIYTYAVGTTTQCKLARVPQIRHTSRAHALSVHF